MTAPPPGPGPRAPRLAALVRGALVLAVGAALAAWTWRAWPDPVVDFGRELYVPWRLAQGAVLFRDLAWFNGPLSPYLNAALFALFGPGLMTLAWANLGVLAAAVWLAHGIVARAAGPAAALAATLVFLTVFAFAQLVGIANYNWVAPYSHEATHGLVLALACFAALESWRRTGLGHWLWLGGLALGLDLLTKPETFLAGAAAALVLAAAPGVDRRARSALELAAATLVPPLVALGLLALALPPGEALRGVLGAWPSVLEGRVSELAFYRAGMGLDDPAARAGELLRWSLGWLAALVPALAAGLAARGSDPVRRAWAAGAALVTLGGLWLVRDQVAWMRVGRPLPLAAAAVGAVALLCVARARAGSNALGGSNGANGSAGAVARERAVRALALAALALTLLLKMLLQARTTNYGFTLALPAALLVTAALIGWLPAWLERRGGSGQAFRAGAAAALAFVAAAHLVETGRWLERKTVTVGAGRDAFRADVRGDFVNGSVRAVRGGSVRSLAVLPEGIMLNYLARVPNPTPYVNFMPPEMLLFGEEAWLDAFRAAPPDIVMFVHKDSSEYGYPLFGTDYGVELADWVRSTYRPVGLLGQEPLVPGTTFGVRMFARGKAP